MPKKGERKPLLSIPMRVTAHNTNEVSDRDDTFIVSFKSLDGSLSIGLRDAAAVMRIKAADDIVKHNFPMDMEFTVEIHEKVRSEPIPKPQSTPTTLDSTTDPATTLEPAPATPTLAGICTSCGLPNDLCTCPSEQEKADAE